MAGEKRNQPRVNTHIVLEMAVSGENKHYFGYIENLSEGGMGIVSLEPLPLGTRVTSGFYLSDDADKLSPIASLVHSQFGSDTLYYHGFKFEFLRDRDKETLTRFVHDRMGNQTIGFSAATN